MRIVHHLQVRNRLGLHARPASIIAKMVQNYQSKVFISYKDREVDARSMMNILMLAIQESSWITIAVDGDDAEEVFALLTSAFESGFGELES